MILGQVKLLVAVVVVADVVVAVVTVVAIDKRRRNNKWIEQIDVLLISGVVSVVLLCA